MRGVTGRGTVEGMDAGDVLLNRALATMPADLRRAVLEAIPRLPLLDTELIGAAVNLYAAGRSITESQEIARYDQTFAQLRDFPAVEKLQPETRSLLDRIARLTPPDEPAADSTGSAP